MGCGPPGSMASLNATRQFPDAGLRFKTRRGYAPVLILAARNEMNHIDLML
jgi:hypothetical protein